METSLCNTATVLQEPSNGHIPDFQTELKSQTIIEAPENKIAVPIKPDLTKMKKGQCSDDPSRMRMPKNRCMLSVKSDSVDSSQWGCCKCLPESSEQLMNEGVLKGGLIDILSLPLTYHNYPWTRVICDFSFVCRSDFNGRYVSFTKDVLSHSRIVKAIQAQMEADEIAKAGDNYMKADEWIKPYEVNVMNSLDRMSASISGSLIRMTSWVLYKLFRTLLSSIVVHKGQMHVVQRTCKKGYPMVFLPVHRSHLDYILISFILFNFNMRPPYVAAGDNLILPLFGMLLRGLGGFFIRRKMEDKKNKRDFIYRAVLHAYVEQILTKGESLEFFIEGGRSRSGKILTPKTGLLSIVVDTYLQGAVEDVSIVPVSISYEKLPEVNFIDEQLGLTKKSETFWGTLVQSLKSLFGFYGSVRIDFSQPFSLKEFVETHRKRTSSSSPTTNKHEMMRSCSETFITSDNNNDRNLVCALADHVAQDQTRIHSVSSTHLLAWVLLHVHREGAPLNDIVSTFDSVREQIATKGHGLGFTGSSEDVVMYAVYLLGDHLVELVQDENENKFIRPITSLPHVIELSYYANTVNMVFSVESVIANSIYSICNLKNVNWTASNQMSDFIVDEAIEESIKLLQLLRHEFAFSPVCESLESSANSALASLYDARILFTRREVNAEALSVQFKKVFEHDDEDESLVYGVKLESMKAIMTLKSVIGPILENYHITSSHLYKLLKQDLPESEFLKEIHSHLKQRAFDGVAEFGESASLDTLRNCIRAFQDLEIVSCYESCDLKMIGLLGDYGSVEVLDQFVAHLASYRS